jgi:hypothetical protein
MANPTDPDQRWEVWAVPFCSTGSGPTPTPTSAVTSAPTPLFVGTPSPTPPTPVTPAPTSAEFPVAACHGADPLTCGCISDGQASYRGDVALTISGLTCQAWDSQAPHGHSLTPDDVPNAGLESNCCRNPDEEDAAWCYTTDPNVRWELCAAPTCDACDAADPDTCGCPQVGQADYRRRPLSSVGHSVPTCALEYTRASRECRFGIELLPQPRWRTCGLVLHDGPQQSLGLLRRTSLRQLARARR